MSSLNRVAIIGGGISGIAAARYLQKKGIDFTIFEKSNKLGGRIKSEKVDGYILDEGFQVLLDNYEEVAQLISYENLNSYTSPSGAVIRINHNWHKLGNPLKRIGDTWSALMNPVGTVKDKLLVFTLSQKAQKLKNPWTDTPNISTQEFLKDYGFSRNFIENFFIPFFGGVFLDFDLNTSARLFMYLFGKFNSGNVILPENGMGDLISEIAKSLPPESIKLNTKIDAIQGTRLTLESGETVSFDKVIDARNAQQDLKWNGTQCFYFTANRVSNDDLGYLHLNPKGQIVRHVAFLNRINPNYSPKGKDLLSVTVHINDTSDHNAVAKELHELFPGKLNDLQFLKMYNIPKALPIFNGDMAEIEENELGQIVIGDATQYPSINGAIASGRKAAELI